MKHRGTDEQACENEQICSAAQLLHGEAEGRFLAIVLPSFDPSNLVRRARAGSFFLRGDRDR